MKNKLKAIIIENNNHVKLLNEKQKDKINKSANYVRAKGISLYDSEVFRKDLIEMYFERSIRNETIDLSENQSFCDSFIKNCPKHKFEPLLYILYCFSSATLLYIIFDLFFSNPDFITVFTIARDVITLFIILLSYFIMPRFALSSNQAPIYAGVLLCILIFTPTFLYITQNVHSLFILPSWIRLIVHVLFFIIMTVLWKNHNRNLSVNA